MLEILGLHAVPRNGPCLQNQPIQGSALLQDIWSGDREMQVRFATGENEFWTWECINLVVKPIFRVS
jgi:hypothetical protein